MNNVSSDDIMKFFFDKLRIPSPIWWGLKKEKKFLDRAFEAFVETLMHFGTTEIIKAMRDKDRRGK
jgi:hypothetical protein